MSSVSFLRHAGFFGPEDAQQHLNIIGVGATGSYIGLTAAKMGFHKFRIWDPDIVEDHNLPNQIYDIEHIGKRKVDAFKQVIQRFNPMAEIETHDYYFKANEHKALIDGPLVLTVDTMSARHDIYDAFRLNWKVKNVFETRLGFAHAEINIIDNMNSYKLEKWKSSLFNDEDVPDGPCNLRICTTLVNMVAAQTVHTICHMLSSERRGTEYQPAEKLIFNLSNSELQTYAPQ